MPRRQRLGLRGSLTIRNADVVGDDHRRFFALTRPNEKHRIRSNNINQNINHRLLAPKTVGYNPLLVILKEKKEKEVQDDADDQDDDGWGFDLDDKVVADFDPSSLTSSASSGADGKKTERDLFIPIVAIVSIVGFAGLYGFEMMRLFFQGELYLPFMH